MAKASKTPVASSEKDTPLSGVAKIAQESAKAALAKLDAMDAPLVAAPVAAPEKAPEAKAARKPKRAGVPEGFCYGLIFGKGMKIRRTFSSIEAAFDHVRALPVEKAREVKLATVSPLKVELRVEFLKDGDDDA